MAAAAVADDALSKTLRRDLAFVKKLIDGARTVDEHVAAANAAEQIAKRANELAMKESKHREITVIAIRNLPTGNEWGWRGVRSWLTDTLSCQGIRNVVKDFEKNVATVFFSSETDRKAAEELILTVQPPGDKPLVVEHGPAPEYKPSALREQELQQHREQREQQREAGGGGKRGRGEASGDGEAGGRGGRAHKAPKLWNVRDVVCPLWAVPYRDQLRGKLDRVGKALSGVSETLAKVVATSSRHPGWLKEALNGRTAKPCCPLEGILRSPVLEAYRNKNEFTVATDADGKPNVGFLLGSFVDGITQVAEPSPTRHTSKTAVRYAHLAAEYIRDHSKLPVWEKRDNKGGFWRLLIVREGRKRTFLPMPADKETGTAGALVQEPITFSGLDVTPWQVQRSDVTQGAKLPEAEPQAPHADNVMVIVQVNPKYNAEPAVMAKECSSMVAFLRSKAAAEGIPLTSVRTMHHWGCANAAPQDAPLLAPSELGQGDDPALDGPAYIEDTLADLTFRISPAAFFQVNSAAATVLYKLVGDWAVPNANTLLLDICCGTGTIGLTLAHRVTKVVGIDLVASAIEDAKHNAQLNNITNAEYMCGKAEDVLPLVLARHKASETNLPADSPLRNQEIVAIADPPRAGLHKSVVNAMLACAPLKRLVYVSCNPDSLAENLVHLCAPPRPGTADPWVPFTPVKAMALDLFPHTSHVETVVLLERQ